MILFLKALERKPQLNQLRPLLIQMKKNLKASHPVAIYIDSRTFVKDKRLHIAPSSSVTPQMLIPRDLYLKANKSLLRAITEIVC